MAYLRRSGALIAVLGLALIAAAAMPADANHSWGKYHWARTSNPLALQLFDNVDQRWDADLDTASSDWSLSSVLDTTTPTGSTDPAKCGPTSGTVQVCNFAYGINGWLGLAQIWITRGSHIAQGVAKMNDSYLGAQATYQYNNAAERLHVMCQEVGHTFGLGHQSETGASLSTCMDYSHSSDADTSSTHPNQHDYDQLVKIYTHLDRFNTAAANAGGTSGITVNGHAPDGTPNGAAPALGHWYIEPLGGGEFLLTHVYWAH